MRILAAFFLVSALAAAQGGPDLSADEQRSLSDALAEAGSSPVEFVRALEKHLDKYPKTPKRSEIERALVKGAIETKDDRRIVLYGERVLAREQDDLQVLERVARALLANDDEEGAARALKYAKRYGELVGSMRLKEPPGRVNVGQWQDELDRGIARSMALEARATGTLGQIAEAVTLAEKSYSAFPTAEAAREIARWLIRQGKDEAAIPRLADAFTIADPKTTETDRAKDRQRMGELYRKSKGTEQGLGDLILLSWDRTRALLEERSSRLRQLDPNASASKILDFTVTGLKGEKLALSTLKGKAVIFDFWATWCGPCRVQHPLYEQVKERFKSNHDVVFLSVSTDDDRGAVEPFLAQNNWGKRVYFEDGMAGAFSVSSIPTTIVVNRRGDIVSRMNGFLPDRFVAMLSERIEEALK